MPAVVRKFVSITAIPIVLLLFHNQAANWHLHKLPNGILIEHAHPYTNNSSSEFPFQNHQHSSLEIHILAIISSFIGLAKVVFNNLLLLARAPLQIARIAKSIIVKYSYHFSCALHRGPPQLMFC